MTTPPGTMNPTGGNAAVDAAIPSKGVRRMLGVSLQTWENATVVFLIIAGVFAVLAGVATWSVVRMQKTELAESRSAFDTYKLAAETQVIAARKDALEAGNRAGNALLRAAVLEKEAAELKAANLALEARTAPRRLSSVQTVKMSAILAAGSDLKLAVVSRLFDAEGKDFADDLAATLNNARWPAARHENWTRGDKGVFIATIEGTPLPPEASTLAAALDAAGIDHKTILITGDDKTRMSPWFHPNVLYLIVGAKP